MAPVQTLMALGLAAGANGVSLMKADDNKPFNGCGPLPSYMKKHFSLVQNPGAGTNPDEMAPYEESFKDGFLHTACVLDTLKVSGDKFGNGKFSYKLGETHNVAIVNYDDHVPKEDREPITHKVCFEFCRTIKEMLFFGVTNGRGCYCAPYFEQEAGDSSECDQPCDGNTEEMCGGKTKSDIFEMHTCGKADENLDNARDTLTKDLEKFAAVNGKVETAAASMQAAAETLQQVFGQVGDGASSDLCQKAKAFAGKMEHSAAAGNEHLTAASDLLGAGDKPEGDRAKEQLTEKMEKDIETTKTLSKDVTAYATAGIAPAKSGADDLYKPVMYFVDKEFQEVPSTCGGDIVGDPLIGSFSGCAVACEMQVGKCVGFQFMPTGEEAKTSAYAYEYEYSYEYYAAAMFLQEDEEEEVQGDAEGLCFLFEKLDTAFYYTGCGGGKSSFLQKKKEASDTKCVVKASEFFGTDISPNPSGKCKGCLKKVTKADRCFE